MVWFGIPPSSFDSEEGDFFELLNAATGAFGEMLKLFSLAGNKPFVKELLEETADVIRGECNSDAINKVVGVLYDIKNKVGNETLDIDDVVDAIDQIMLLIKDRSRKEKVLMLIAVYTILEAAIATIKKM